MNQETLPVLAPTQEERYWAAAAHALALLLAFLTSWFVGIAGVVGAAVVYFLKRDSSTFVADQAREAINFNLSMLIYACAAMGLGALLVGATIFTLGLGVVVTGPLGILLVLLAAAIAIMWLVCSVIASIKAYNGESYRYPLTFRLIS